MSMDETLTKWYNKNKRSLPWRDTKDPYTIWISEIILQQTRIDQGTPYFIKFIKTFPNISALANAKEDKVLHLWQGLGYYSRARNLHFTARYIYNELNGDFPNNYNDIIKLKGIGEYTAAAIASFCFKEKVAAIDGNVFRVITRLFDINKPIDKSIGKKEVVDICNELIPADKPDEFNQAIMDFGATICTPKSPKCSDCILSAKCLSKKNNTFLHRPVKSIRTKQKDRYFTYLVLYDNNDTIICKRSKNDIWKELYEFPLIESDDELTMEELKQNTHFRELIVNEKILELKVTKVKPHILSHQKIMSTFITIHTEKIKNDTNTKTSLKSLKNYAFPVLISNFINSNLN